MTYILHSRTSANFVNVPGKSGSLLYLPPAFRNQPTTPNHILKLAHIHTFNPTSFLKMEPHPLFDLSDSWVEIDGWVIVDVNPKTGSIHMYEDYESSAESFLVELDNMQMLPSMRMPIPSTSTLESERDLGGVSASEGDDGWIAARKNRESVWAEIKKNLSAALELDDDDEAAKDTGEVAGGSGGLEEEGPDVADSPRREGSESPETDPDFMQSSSGTNGEWVLTSGMVGLKVSDSLFMVESKGGGAKSVSGEVGKAGESPPNGSISASHETNKDDTEMIEVEKDDDTGETVKDAGEDNEDSEDSADRNQRRKDRRNVGLAASAIAVMLAAIWMMETKYGLG
jgi:hypothetical protein